MSSKNAILSRLRHGRAASPANTAAFAAERAPDAVTPDLDIMVSALEAAHARVFRSTTGQWADDLAKLARERGRARAGIAETGTLVVESSPQVPRTLSLVPPVHVVVIDEDSVVGSLHQALAHYENKSLPTNLIFISGPSKTADIQQTLAYGAHGPRELIVYLCRRE